MAALDILSAGAAQALVRRFAALKTIELHGHFGAVGAMREKLIANEPCDLVILTRAMINALEAEGRIIARPIADLGAVSTAIATKAGDARRAPGTAEALRVFLADAPEIFIPDPVQATAGQHVIRVLEQLGLIRDLKPRLRLRPNGATAMAALASQGTAGAIGCTQATEIRATAGVRLAGPLPKGCDRTTIYTAAISTGTRREAEARAFLGALAGPEAAALRQEAGFE